MDSLLISLPVQLKVCPKRVCISTVGVRTDLYPRDLRQVPITNFFGSNRPIELVTSQINITLVEEDYRL